MATGRSRSTQLAHPPPKSSSLSSLSSYLPLSPPIASSSKLSYFPPFVPSEPVPELTVERFHRKGKSLSAIAGWSLGLGFTLGTASGSCTPESIETQEVERPQTPVQALSSSLHQSRHSSSSTRHVLQPVIDGHSQIKRSQSPRQSDRSRGNAPTTDGERESGMERDRRRGMELLLGVLGSKANGSDESLVECAIGDKTPNDSLHARYRDSRNHQASKSSKSSSVTPSVRSPSRTPFKPASALPHPGLRRANSARTPNQTPPSLKPLPQLKQRKTKPPLRLSLSHPSWSRPTPSPPITSLSPSLPSELFDFMVENPITPPASTCHSPVIGRPLERTVSETETLRPTVLTPRAHRPQPRPPPVETSSESESEDGALRTPCLSSSPVMALQPPHTTKAVKRPVRDGRRAPWR